MQVDFFLRGDPPTATAQEKAVRVVNGHPFFYDRAPVKAAKKWFLSQLMEHRLEKPMEGPLELTVAWKFERKRHRDGEWRTSTPDTDNLEKGLKDLMTAAGFWKNDAQVVIEHACKLWSSDPGVHITVRELEETK